MVANSSVPSKSEDGRHVIAGRQRLLVSAVVVVNSPEDDVSDKIDRGEERCLSLLQLWR
jgi:hypothetical protein